MRDVETFIGICYLQPLALRPQVGVCVVGTYVYLYTALFDELTAIAVALNSRYRSPRDAPGKAQIRYSDQL